MYKDLFEKALHIESPWYVKNSEEMMKKIALPSSSSYCANLKSSYSQDIILSAFTEECASKMKSSSLMSESIAETEKAASKNPIAQIILFIFVLFM